MRRRGLIWHEPRSTGPDPGMRDVAAHARREMRVFDQLEPETRSAFANSLFGPPVAATVSEVIRRGARNDVKAVLRERGLFPCDVGTEGVVVETVKVLDREESQRLKRTGTG